MTLLEFQNLIQDKFFVELATTEVVSLFTDLTNQTSIDIRQAAQEAGVIVFLKTINKIWARGVYYGINQLDVDSIISRIAGLETSIQSIGTPLAGLAALAQENSTDITKLQTLIGASELAEGANSILTRITSIENDLSGLVGDNLSTTINNLVDSRLQEVLDSKIESYLTTNNYVTSDDLTTINESISNLTSSINEKAAQTDFSNLVALIGAGSLTSENWGKNPKTVITVINELTDTTQSLSADLSTLSSTVSGIPKFDIKVMDSIPTIYEGQLPNDINTTTIYLVPSPDDEKDLIPSGQTTSPEMYTEYICININAGKKNEQNEPLAPYYKWEKLGRQSFKMSNYLTEQQINEITEDLSDRITTLVNQLGEAGENSISSQISTINTTISGLQSSIDLLLPLIDEEGNFALTGENIYTNSTKDVKISESISSLQNNKLDKNSLSWVIINDSIQPQE